MAESRERETHPASDMRSHLVEGHKNHESETRTTCEECGLSFLYDPKFHKCRTGPRKLAGPWLDEIERLQGVRFIENR